MNETLTRVAPALLAALWMAAPWLACSESPPGSGSKAGDAVPAGAERKVLYWKSPMDPTFISKSPGKDSMGMDLVPVYEGEEPEGPPGTVRIDPATIQNIGVTTAVVERKRLSREIRTVGRLDYDETKVRRIAPKIGGWVEDQHVNFPGQVVRSGEPLLEIYSPELVSTQEEYLVALRYQDRLHESTLHDAVTGANDLVRAAETRLRYWNISDRQIDALRARGEITRTMVLHAPFRGIVVDRMIPEGGFLQPGQTVYTIADISTIWVYADVYEYEAPWLRVGQQATMTLAYQPGVTHRGEVTYVYPYLDKKTRTIQVRMEFPNTPGLDLKPDMWANVMLDSEVAREGIAVPLQAVIRTGQRDVAFVALEGGRFEPRDVRLGAQAGDEFEVLDGLAEGERVVTSAQFLINSESNLQSAVRKMMGGGGGPAAPMEMPGESGGARQGEKAPGPSVEDSPAPAHSGHGPE
ncbi:MAG: efflux RND transporter periplasmic adaptor subunit [Myxococcota bacterium]|nr:efflux RND transporter periplasmic adaptor subunit [Myxococcota bacterium]